MVKIESDATLAPPGAWVGPTVVGPVTVVVEPGVVVGPVVVGPGVVVGIVAF